MTVSELRKLFCPALAPEDSLILLAHATGKEQVFLLAHPEHIIGASDEALARSFFRRRLRHEPVAYITGHKEFYGQDFIVTKDTLIPRPETEHLVERVLDRTEHHESMIRGGEKNIHILDIGTGSGNIIISIAAELNQRYPASDIRYHATDISPQALEVAKENARRHDVSDLITFREGDLLEPFAKECASADAIIIAANLPYLSEAIYATAENDVKKFEPHDALVSGQAGLGHYYRLLDQAKRLAKPAMLLLEISPEQAPLLRTCLVSCLPQAKISIYQDLSGRDRVAEIVL